ncbi:MAG TPA: hypothetical protein VHA15_08065 [Burkholderiales bacterium]|jgi:hypothetical protein|nr:hypothetical protein [Burkholderiales bacterium]
MNIRRRAARLPALLALPCAATFAAAALAQAEPVDISQEPRHRLKFENEHVRFFDVQLEPGYQALYHWHRNDGLFINLYVAPTIAQDVGQAPVERGGRAIGEAYFINYAARPKAHRVSNPGKSEYRVTDTEILQGCGAQGDMAEGPNQTLVVDNERVFVTRILLHPGESSELRAPCGMFVSVSGGNVTFEGPQGTESLAMPIAGFKWRKTDETIRLTNAGNTVFHAVDIRIK